MNTYIIFKIDKTSTRKYSKLDRIFQKILFLILPNANPDFESKIDLVETWYLEFENIDDVPTREIGLNFEGKVIVKMPYKKNYGYWTDNLLKYKDFEKLFKIKIISKQSFLELWDELK